MKQHCGIKFHYSLLYPMYFFRWLGLAVFYLFSLFPASMRHTLGRRIGQTIYNKKSKRYNTVNTNLKIAFPELNNDDREVLILKHFYWYGSALIDYSLLFFANKRRLSKMLEIDGREHIDNAINNNQSIMILLAHSVMLEFAPAALGLEYDCFGSYKTSKNALLDWIITKSRCRFVRFVVSREEGLRKLVKSLTPKKLMIFLPDEDLGTKNAVFAPFYGKQKSTLTTTARIAKISKAVALPTFAYFDSQKGKYIVKLGKPLENYPSGDAIKDATKLNQGLEALIEQNPEQYMWLMKWYKTRPEGEEPVY